MVACSSLSLHWSHSSSSHAHCHRDLHQPISLCKHTRLYCHTQSSLGLYPVVAVHPERSITPCQGSPIPVELATAFCQLSPTQAEQSTGFHHVSAPHTERQSRLGSSETKLPHGLDPPRLPRHVAIIMDGNSRWAESRGLLHTAGHEAGLKCLKQIIKRSVDWGIHALTVYAFSTENWQRPQVEVSFLMKLFHKAVVQELESLIKANIQVRVIGDCQSFSLSLQSLVQEVEQKTAQNTGMKFTVAASYGGRYDIARACQQISTKVQQGKLNPEDITESLVGKELGTSWVKDTGDPDLLIRTGGERRLSNFLLWELAYTELLFLDVMWPDMDEVHYADALLYYQRRNRRYGVRSRVSLR